MFEDIESLLKHEIFKNPVQDYLIAFFGSLLIWACLSFGRKWLIRMLSQWEVTMKLGGLRYVTRALLSINPIVIVWISIHLASQYLHQSSKMLMITNSITKTVVILQLTALVATFTSFLIHNMDLGRSKKDKSLDSIKANFTVIAKTGIWAAGILFLFSNLGIDVTTFVAGLGVGGIAVALAAQTILGDAFSSFSISLDKPFEVGDDIMVENFRGTVESIGLKTTRLRSANGELLVFPNSYMSNAKISNFQDLPERRFLLRIGFTYETSNQKLEEIPQALENIIKKYSGTRFERAHFLEFGDSALIYEVAFWVKQDNPAESFQIRQNINFDIRRYLEKESIQMAYPTQTVFLGKGEKGTI